MSGHHTNTSVHERLYNEHKQLEEAKKRYKEALQEDVSECTFHPNITSSMLNHTDMLVNKRSTEEFYSEQLKFKE